MPNRSVEKTGILTEQQLKFIACWQGSAVAAAAAAGYKDPVNAGYKLMQLEPIREGIRMKQNAIAEETGRALGKQIAVCRADVINRLWDLAMMDPDNTKETITGQIRASEALANILGISIKRKADVTKQLEGKTQADIDYFVAHGYFPEPEEEEDLRAEIPQLQRQPQPQPERQPQPQLQRQAPQPQREPERELERQPLPFTRKDLQ